MCAVGETNAEDPLGGWIIDISEKGHLESTVVSVEECHWLTIWGVLVHAEFVESFKCSPKNF